MTVGEVRNIYLTLGGIAINSRNNIYIGKNEKLSITSEKGEYNNLVVLKEGDFYVKAAYTNNSYGGSVCLVHYSARSGVY